MDELTGRTLGDYLLSEVLGSGGWGVVYRALHRTLNRPRAVKVLPLQLAQVTLVDFGLAHAVEYGEEGRLTDSDLKPGTPEYMAPERIEGISEGPSIDHYALGVMAYELLTGRVPFAREKSLQVLYAHVHR